MKLVYPAIFTPLKEGGYMVNVMDLPGCITEGRDMVESIEMGTDAACGWILGEMEDGNQFPAPTDPLNAKAPKGSFVTCLTLDIETYAERFGNRAVRRNVTLPAWQDTYVQKKRLSLSRLVQDCIIKLAMNDN